MPIAVSGIIAYLLDPFVSWLQKKGLSRLKSVITVFTSFIVAIVVMGLIIVPPIVSQAKDLFTARGLTVRVN
ncbi:AI-2E family transporter [Rubritalea tangerina]|uniref:AI-2E family transporter n=1 Tax=Rubritalea tangerina TaxID=430798 RepID=UPI0036078DAF